MSVKSPIIYSIANDISSQSINVIRLKDDIIKSNIRSSFVNDITINDGEVEITFNGLLSDTDKSKLDFVIQNHSGKPVPNLDEIGRQRFRTDSLDDHDTSFFTGKSDKINNVTSPEVIGEGNEVQTEFYFPKKEIIRGTVKVYLDEVELDSSNYTIDYTEYDSNYNEILHFCRGKLTFNEAPGDGVEITATYSYGTIGDGESFFLNFGLLDDTKIVTLLFIDPVHIKSGTIYYSNGTSDSIVRAYVESPADSPYYDNNRNIIFNNPDGIKLSQYVNEIVINGDGSVEFQAEARANAIPPFFALKIEVNNGSSIGLKVWGRLDVHRQRTVII